VSNKIVQVNVSITQAPAPSRLQETGAMLTQGGTNTAPGTLTLLTSAADLEAILESPVPLVSLAWSGGTVTADLTVPQDGWTVGDVVPITIAGAAPIGYNGSYQGTVVDSTHVTYPLAGNPGMETTPGTIQLGAAKELQQMVTTFYAQPSAVNQSVYVLELGEGEPAAGVAALTDFILHNPQVIYSYLVPREWDNVSDFVDILADYDAPNALTYFFVTTTVANRAIYAGHKCVLAAVESPTVTPNEFSLAAEWAVTLNYNPSSTNQVPPLSFAFVYGVSPYPLRGNQTIFTELNTANVGWVGTGAEGGISTSIVFYGQMQDGNPFNFWYSADWAELNIDLALANEIILGSNNPAAPLYYNQPGINRLQNRGLQTLGQAVTNGLAIGKVKGYSLPAEQFRLNYLAGQYEGQIALNAEPFLIYSNENPSDYSIGRYAGFSCVYTPSRGFKQVLFDLNVTNIIAAP
jgi:hypothetical protein